MKRKNNTQHGSFVVDILLLPFIGLAAAWFTVKVIYGRLGWCKMAGKIIMSAVFLIFCGVATGLYFDLFSFSFLSPLSGNDFMWNWPVEPLFDRRVAIGEIPTYENFWGVWNMWGLFLLFGVYPLVFWLGIKIGSLYIVEE